MAWPGTASLKDTSEGDAAVFQQRGELAGDYSVQREKGPSNNLLPECMPYFLPEEFLEEQSCESKMVFVTLFLNYSRAGSLQLYYHLPLSARFQKLKTKQISFSLPQSLGESHQKANEAESVTQKLSTLAW